MAVQVMVMVEGGRVMEEVTLHEVVEEVRLREVMEEVRLHEVMEEVRLREVVEEVVVVVAVDAGRVARVMVRVVARMGLGSTLLARALR